jgi:4,5:9,10-diseco-3-hydroxy-5,9,17-trioxoandrosta-1(10),2-diene-4-oate hydrolase
MTLESETSREITTASGIRIHYHDLGTGDPLVLIHGGGPGAYGWSNYSRNIEHFAKTHRTITVDLPGYGRSDKKTADASIYEFLSEAILGVLDALGIAKASFIGNSLGGGTSLKLALRHPDRVDRLILMGAGGGLPVFSTVSEGIRHIAAYYLGDGPSFAKLKAFVQYMVHDPLAVTDEMIEARYQVSRHPETVASPPLKGLGMHPGDHLWRDRLELLTHKTLLVWGREDRTITLDNAFVFLRAIPNAELHVFPHCGHWAQWEKADDFNTLVSDFLARG